MGGRGKGVQIRCEERKGNRMKSVPGQGLEENGSNWKEG